jgi:hypothetical protein
VNDTLPVIAQGWFCGSSRERIAERFPKRASVVGNQGVAASSELGLAWRDRKPATRDSVQLRFRVRGAPPQIAVKLKWSLVTAAV